MTEIRMPHTSSRPGHRKRLVRAAAIYVAVLSVLGVAACGGSGKSSTTKAQAAAPATATSTSSTATSASSTTKHQSASHKTTAGHTTTSASHATHRRRRSNHATTSTSTTSAATTTTTSTAKTTNSTKPKARPKPPAYVRPMRATMTGQNHSPKAGKLWTYTVVATDAHGRPLSGTVDTEFVFGGTVVGHETPPTHKLKNGRLHDKVTFPPSSVGVPLKVQVVVHAALGTTTLDWAVKPRK